jgi:hypothetical protein
MSDRLSPSPPLFTYRPHATHGWSGSVPPPTFKTYNLTNRQTLRFLDQAKAMRFLKHDGHTVRHTDRKLGLNIDKAPMRRQRELV